MPEVSAVPGTYRVAGGAEFRLKAVTAEFDGSGAAGAYLPGVTIVSPGGLVTARAIDPNVSVAAGASAEVSFFPGVKSASSAAGADAFCPWQFTSFFTLDNQGAWEDHITVLPVVDTACLYNGYVKTDGTQGAFTSVRFSIGPFGSIWGFKFIYLQGPTYGRITGYLASIPENDPASGYPVDTGVLQRIDTLNFIKAFKIEGYNAVLRKNNLINVGVTQPGHNYFNSNAFRPMGAVGAPFTTITSDGSGVNSDLDGGPGMYALKLICEEKDAASAGYDMAIQALTASREDWAFA